MQALLKKEMQLRRELEERLSNESSLTDQPRKAVAVTKVLSCDLCLYDQFTT